MNGRQIPELALSPTYTRQLALDDICAAAYAGDVKRIREITMQYGHDDEIINNSQEFGITPLLLAVMKGRRDVVELLLAAPCINVNALVPNGEFKNSTALILAAALGDANMVKAIASNPKVLPNLKNIRGDFALKLAVNWCPDAIPALLQIPGMHLNLKDSYGRSALFNAVLAIDAFTNQEKIPAGLAALINLPRLIIDSTNEENWTPLMVAVQRKHVLSVEALLKAGAKASYAAENGFSVLTLAELNTDEATRETILDLIRNAIAAENKAALDAANNIKISDNPAALFKSALASKQEQPAIEIGPMTP